MAIPMECVHTANWTLLKLIRAFAVRIKETWVITHSTTHWVEGECSDMTGLIIGLEEENKTGCFAFIVLPLYCYCKFFVALPHGVVVWSAVCD